jgi:hypothetical protein
VSTSTSQTSDTHFFHSFSIVLGLLFAFTIVLFIFARIMGSDYQKTEQLEDPLVKNAALSSPAPQNPPQQSATP